MSDRKIYVVGGSYEYANWCQAKLVGSLEAATIVLFTGGSDVTPALYNQMPHPTTSTSWRRDKEELAIFDRAKEMNLPMLGICRGAQFLCVMAGGKLVQHQSHPYLHDVTTSNGEVMRVNSTHHQRQYIKGIEEHVELLAWAEHISPFSYGQDNDDVMDCAQEVEIAFYKNIRGLAIQPHPEMLHPSREDWEKTFVSYCRNAVSTYLE